MMARRLLMLLIFFSCACTLWAQMPLPADSSLMAIRALYEKGAYVDAEVEARRFLEQPFVSDSLRIQAEEYIAFSLVAQGKPKAAVMHFSAILDADSTFDLDPLYTSPKIMASLAEARQLRRLHTAGRSMPGDAVPHRTESLRAGAPGVSWRAIVFPGWEQLYQGRPTAGYVFLGAGAAAAALSIGFEIERAAARRDYLDARTSELAASRYTRYNRAWKAEAWSLIALAAVYLSSELDAFITPVPAPEHALLPAAPAASLHLAIRF